MYLFIDWFIYWFINYIYMYFPFVIDAVDYIIRQNYIPIDILVYAQSYIQ